MKTPTLIVRLVALYVLVRSALGLIEISRVETSVPSQATMAQNNPLLGDMKIECWIGCAIGLLAVLFAGALARWLTFDAEPAVKKAPTLRDELM